ncbi:MerR family transcriptional regulator [Nonomuraea angiospora]|uniref:DNA-binding transcriptional MerR regulator n=1 Tax=Nonomuraea angiospora TaxID=46172 RepID=A0ABR9MF78_9ACTN|nr:MerR family transcriptional regulator [Nonomuraea angiospora]MBE1591162.1 DNA-binding transcriptional MerR regulator [Nonomuraea angiospora]MDX3104792.1 MerR family transcriptional regulator [Nonomuraea angiospora]
MRISELSAKSGVAIPTIKYYLRESLLHPGEQTAATRAEYDESHLRRLRLIRALLEVGRLPVASIKKIIEAVEDESLPVHLLLGTAHYALSAAVEPEPGEEWQSARDEVDRLIADQGWDVTPGAPSRDELAQTIVRMRQLGLPVDLKPYVEIAQKLVSEVEMNTIPFDGPREAAVEALVLGTVLYGKAFEALRRMAQESESARRLSP